MAFEEASTKTLYHTTMLSIYSCEGRTEVRWRPEQETIWRLHIRTKGLSGANVLY